MDPSHRTEDIDVPPVVEATAAGENPAGRGSLSRRRFLAVSGGAAALATLSACEAKVQSDQGGKTSSGKTDTSTGTSARTAPSNKELTVALIMQQLSAQSQQTAAQVFKDYVKARKLPWDLQLQNAQGDPGMVANMITNAASKKVDAVVVGFQQLDQMTQPLNALKSADIPLFTLDGGITPATYADITSNNYVIGALMSDYLVSRLQALGKAEGGAKVCAIYYNGSVATRRRGEEFQLALKENPWIELLDSRVITAQGYFENSRNIVTDWLNRFGGEVDAFFMPWDEPAAATAQSVKAKGLTNQDVFVVGADGTRDQVKAMVNDPGGAQMATCAQEFELWAPLCASYIERIVANGEPREKVLPTPSSSLPVSLLVRGVNMESAAKRKYPWQEDSYPDLLEAQATKVAGL